MSQEQERRQGELEGNQNEQASFIAHQDVAANQGVSITEIDQPCNRTMIGGQQVHIFFSFFLFSSLTVFFPFLFLVV